MVPMKVKVYKALAINLSRDTFLWRRLFSWGLWLLSSTRTPSISNTKKYMEISMTKAATYSTTMMQLSNLSLSLMKATTIHRNARKKKLVR